MRPEVVAQRLDVGVLDDGAPGLFLASLRVLHPEHGGALPGDGTTALGRDAEAQARIAMMPAQRLLETSL